MSEAEARLLGAIDAQELTRLTSELVRIDSVIRPETGGTERRAVAYIAAWIRKELGVEPLVEEVAPGRENIIATLDSGLPGACLMLEGHTDVVTEGDRSSWTHDPFGGEASGGRIWGRGSCDMKAGLAVALVTVGSPSVTFMVLRSPAQGAAQINVMPGQAEGYVEIRTTPAQEHESVRAALRGILSRLAAEDPKFSAAIEFIEDRPVVSIGKDEPIAAIAAGAFRDVTGRETR